MILFTRRKRPTRPKLAPFSLIHSCQKPCGEEGGQQASERASERTYLHYSPSPVSYIRPSIYQRIADPPLLENTARGLTFRVSLISFAKNRKMYRSEARALGCLYEIDARALMSRLNARELRFFQQKKKELLTRTVGFVSVFFSQLLRLGEILGICERDHPDVEQGRH